MIDRNLPIQASAAGHRIEAQGQSILRINALADDAAEVLIYGPIGDFYWDGVSASEFVRDLANVKASTIHLRINSDGGSVDDGIAIHNALKSHPAKVIARIDSVAASISAMIPMAADEIEIYSSSRFMLHKAWAMAAGNDADFTAFAEALRKATQSFSTAIAERTGKSVDDVLAVIADGQDHWFTADEAIEFGLADRVLPDAQDHDAVDTVAASLLTWVGAVGKAPTHIAAELRRRIQSAAKPQVFARLGAAIQRAVVAHIEDPQMKNRLLQIMAGTLVEGVAAAEQNAPKVDPTPASPVAKAEPAPAAPPAPTAPAPSTPDPIAALRDRNERIRGVFAGFRDHAGIGELEAQCLADPSITIEAAQGKLLSKVAAGSQPLNGGGRVEAGEDEGTKFIAGASNALLVKAAFKGAQREAGNQFNGMTLAQLAGHSLAMRGINIRGMSPDQIARKVLAAHTTSDFPLLLSSTAGKMLRAAYESYANTYQLWCGVGSVSDFKAHPRIQLGSFNSLATILEGGEYTYGTVAEESESIQAVTKGRALLLTRQMIVNDDLGGFGRRAQMLGRAAARTVNTDAYTLLTSGSGNNGPTMSDTGQLFNATAVTTAGGHANLAGTPSAITVASISEGRAAMRKQKDKGLNDTLNIMPKSLICPVGKEDIAWAVLNSVSDPSSSNSAKRNYVQSVAALTLITDPFLDGISATAWYLAADPADAPLVEVAFLDGQQSPFIDDEIEFDNDALKFKARLDYGVAAIDWRAGWRNAGA